VHSQSWAYLLRSHFFKPSYMHLPHSYLALPPTAATFYPIVATTDYGSSRAEQEASYSHQVCLFSSEKDKLLVPDPGAEKTYPLARDTSGNSDVGSEGNVRS
jgi:hypothetical protein